VESPTPLARALRRLVAAAGRHVEGLVGETDPFAAIPGALLRAHFDEIILSTLPTHVSHWLRLDLPARVRRLGVPVTVVTASRRDAVIER
jgi:hypothetical protein